MGFVKEFVYLAFKSNINESDKDWYGISYFREYKSLENDVYALS